ncbi:HAD family hydrolase [Leucobacter albus]|uniref:HAD family hydrolase n=1 Tax=Leucobacter albus TaxID=272210 RepID=A0ABW3TMT7_9MICO
MSALPVLIFDFDGTVSLGPGPVRAYATAVAELGGGGSALTADIDRRLQRDAGRSLDGYEIVREVALAHGVGEQQLSRGYLASRELLATPAAPVEVPSGLETFLRGARAERILLTNAPRTRIDAALAALGLAGAFDRVITDAGKPAGLVALLEELDATGERRRVLSIGDVWRNDLAPAHDRGHTTALVGGLLPVDATPDFAAETVTDLLPDFRRWLSDPAPAAVSDN